MIQTHTVTVTVLNDDRLPEQREIDEPLLDRLSGEPVVTEDRAPGPYRALPRDSKDRLIGNPEKGIVGYQESRKWFPVYQVFNQGVLVSMSCWKCQREIVGWMPALRPVRGGNYNEAEQVLVGGQPAVRLTPHNHYREGLYLYQRPNGILGEFSYLHCADCTIGDADGPDLLACFLAGHDRTRETYQLYDDDTWAQWMWRWSGIELIGRRGPSIGIADIMAEAQKRGPHAR